MAQRRELKVLEIKTEKPRALRSREIRGSQEARKDPIVGEVEDEGPEDLRTRGLLLRRGGGDIVFDLQSVIWAPFALGIAVLIG
jgi:hypothetical protein